MDLFDLNENVEMIEYGIVFFFGSVLIAPLYYVVILTIHQRDCRKPNITYKLMNIINVLQLLQGLGHFITSPLLLFPKLHEEIDVIVRIIGCLMNSCWIADLPVMVLLAACRIMMFTRLISPHSLSKYIRLVLFIIFSWTSFVFICGSILQNMKFTVPWWGYDFSVPYTKEFDFLELLLSFPCLAISYTSYVAITYLIYVKKKVKSTVQSRKNEIAILLQYTFVTIYITCLIVIWHPALFTFVPIIDMENTRNQATLNFLWIMNCYMNPVMMLLFNKSIRRDVLKHLNCKCWAVSKRSDPLGRKATVISVVSI